MRINCKSQATTAKSLMKSKIDSRSFFAVFRKASACNSYNADIESKRSAKRQEDLEENHAAKEDNSAAINVYCPECPPGGTIGHPGR